jgi:hypothetical protein
MVIVTTQISDTISSSPTPTKVMIIPVLRLTIFIMGIPATASSKEAVKEIMMKIDWPLVNPAKLMG